MVTAYRFGLLFDYIEPSILYLLAPVRGGKLRPMKESKLTETQKQQTKEPSAVETWLALGMCFGVAFGSVFGNAAIGIALGMCFGIAIGTSLDAQSNKNSG
jgi:hypothetical protein